MGHLAAWHRRNSGLVMWLALTAMSVSAALRGEWFWVFPVGLWTWLTVAIVIGLVRREPG